jgi:hypothetical protein
MKPREYTEKNFQSDFKQWIKHSSIGTAVFELKVSKDTRLAKTRLEPHQLVSLWNAKHGKQYYRIKDIDYLHPKPYDCYQMAGVSAYVVIMFRCIEHGQKQFYLIDIDNWEKMTAETNIVTEKMAETYGMTCKLK